MSVRGGDGRMNVVVLSQTFGVILVGGFAEVEGTFRSRNSSSALSVLDAGNCVYG